MSYYLLPPLPPFSCYPIMTKPGLIFDFLPRVPPRHLWPRSKTFSYLELSGALHDAAACTILPCTGEQHRNMQYKQQLAPQKVLNMQDRQRGRQECLTEYNVALDPSGSWPFSLSATTLWVEDRYVEASRVVLWPMVPYPSTLDMQPDAQPSCHAYAG